MRSALLVSHAISGVAIAQTVAAPGLGEIQRWSRGCLDLPAFAWPAVDLLHDDLIEAIRAISAEGAAAVSAQAGLEDRFIADIAALGGVAQGEPCIELVRSEREAARLRAVLAVRRQRIPMVSAEAIESIVAPLRAVDPEAKAGVERFEAELRRLAGDALRELAGDAPPSDPIARARAAARGPSEAERAFALATAKALSRLKGFVPPEALGRAQGRWARAVSRRRADEVDRAILLMRYLKAGTPEQIARGRPLADQLELAFDERFATKVEEALRSRDPNALGSIESTFTEEEWSRVRGLLPDERGETLVTIAREGVSVEGAEESLLELVTDEGLEYLAPYFALDESAEADGADPTGAARAAFERRALERRWRQRGTRLEAGEREAASVVSAFDAIEDAAAVEAAIAAWRAAHEGPIATMRDELRAARRAAALARGDGEFDPAAALSARERSARLDAALREADDRLRSSLVALCGDARCRLLLAAWRVDRLEPFASPQTSRLSGLGLRAVAPWSGEIDALLEGAPPETAVAVRELALGRIASSERTALAIANARDAEGARELRIAEIEEAFWEELARRQGTTRNEGVRAGERELRALEAIRARALEEHPAPKPSETELANRWAEEIGRFSDDLATLAGPELAERLRLAIGRRIAPSGAGERDLAEFERLAKDAQRKPELAEPLERASRVAYRLERTIVRERLALRYPPSDDEAGWARLRAALERIRAREELLVEDRRLAAERLRRDIALAQAEASTVMPTESVPESTGSR